MTEKGYHYLHNLKSQYLTLSKSSQAVGNSTKFRRLSKEHLHNCKNRAKLADGNVQ